MEVDLIKIDELKTITNEYVRLTKSNDNLLYKKEYLINMLLRLDSILADDNMVIKNMRKKIVVRINNTLDYLDSILSP